MNKQTLKKRQKDSFVGRRVILEMDSGLVPLVPGELSGMNVC